MAGKGWPEVRTECCVWCFDFKGPVQSSWALTPIHGYRWQSLCPPCWRELSFHGWGVCGAPEGTAPKLSGAIGNHQWLNYQASSGLKLPWRRSSGSMWCVWATWGWEHGVCGFSTEEKGKSGRVALLTSVLLGVGWDCFLLAPEMWGRGGVRKMEWAEIASFLPPFLEGLAVACDMPDKLLPLYWNRPIQKYASHLKCCN